MKLVALLLASLVVAGCSGSIAQISQADTRGDNADAATHDAATSSGDVGVSDAGLDAQHPSDDAGGLAADASDDSMVDSGSPPIADASIDVIAAPDATPPPPVDSGPPACVQTPDKTACKYYGSGATGMYSTGIADDGCGSYYDCHAETCGVHSNGPNDAGLTPGDPAPCSAGGVDGWKYSCSFAPEIMPAACVSLSATVLLYCCPIPKDGKPFSEVLF